MINTTTANPAFLGIPIVIPICAQLEDFLASSGKTQQDVCDDLNKYHYARGPAQQYRTKLIEHIEKETGEARETKTVGTGEDAKEVPNETDGAFFERVFGEDTEFTLEQFAEDAQAISDLINWLPSASSGRIGKQWEDGAAAMLITLNKDESGETADRLIANLGAKNVMLNKQPDGTIAARDLAGALKAFDTIVQREKTAALLG
tara:strand:+ start:17004 stop:17615 length:612 start_codon:yes stop_codon:yes gene_type:complete